MVLAMTTSPHAQTDENENIHSYYHTTKSKMTAFTVTPHPATIGTHYAVLTTNTTASAGDGTTTISSLKFVTAAHLSLSVYFAAAASMSAADAADSSATKSLILAFHLATAFLQLMLFPPLFTLSYPPM